jgi:ferredoxin
MKPKIHESCIACNTCEAICPEVFHVDDNGERLIAIVQDVDHAKYKEDIDDAISACPVGAISWDKE